MAVQQAGWYQDPTGDATRLRYWNGDRWTDDYASSQPTPPAGPYGQPAYDAAPVGYPAVSPVHYYQTAYSPNNTDASLRLAAFIFCLLSTIAVGWMLLPLIWMIPMTVICWGIYKGERSNSVAFGVCTLLFVNMIAGILLLVSRKER